MQLSVWVRHKNRVFPREPSVLTIEDIEFLLAHPPSPEWGLLLTPNEDAVQAIEHTKRTVSACLVPVDTNTRAIGTFQLDPEALRYVLENPGAGRYCLTVDVDLLKTLGETKPTTNGREESAPNVNVPPEMTATTALPAV